MGEGNQVRLNLGCGHKPLEGFVNVDLPNNWSDLKPDVEADVRKLPFPNGYADEIHAYHVFEHFERFEAEDILKEWVRVLKPNGLLVLELPCLDKILSIFNYYVNAGQPINNQLTLYGLYGDPKHKVPAMMHRWCYSQAELMDMMEDAGLSVTICKPQTHVAARDMRLEGIKCIPS